MAERTEKEKEIYLDYCRVGFLAEVMLNLYDKIKETNQYRHEVKHALNKVVKECERITTDMYKYFEKEQPTDKDRITNLEILYETIKGYEAFFEIITTIHPNKIPIMVDKFNKWAKEDDSNYLLTINKIER